MARDKINKSGDKKIISRTANNLENITQNLLSNKTLFYRAVLSHVPFCFTNIEFKKPNNNAKLRLQK